MKKVCFLLVILMLAGGQGAWGATIPNIVGTWQGPHYMIWGDASEGTFTAILVVERQVGSLFLGRITWTDYTGPQPKIAGTINNLGEIRINGGVIVADFTSNFEMTGKLSQKSGVMKITGDWREVEYPPLGGSNDALRVLSERCELTKVSD